MDDQIKSIEFKCEDLKDEITRLEKQIEDKIEKYV